MNKIQEAKVRQMVRRILREDHLEGREQQLQYITDNLESLSDEAITEIYNLMETLSESKKRSRVNRLGRVGRVQQSNKARTSRTARRR